jgi:hypothetical protein
LAANFATSADLALLLGGRLKFEEMLSGRFADAFGTLYLGYACLWYHKRNMNVKGIDEVFEYAMETLLLQNQSALKGVASNFPIPGIGSVMSALCFPIGSETHVGPNDAMRKNVSAAITNPTAIRSFLIEGVFISEDPNDRVRMLNDILPLAVKADAAVAAAKKAKRSLTSEEEALVQKVSAAADKLVQVDVFDKLGFEKTQGEGYVRPALRGTKFANIKVAPTVSTDRITSTIDGKKQTTKVSA